MLRPVLHQWFLACTCLLLVGGCAMGERQLPKEPVTPYLPREHEVHYPPQSAVLSDSEEAALHAFFVQDTANRSNIEHIIVLVAQPANPQSSQRMAHLQQLLRQWGYRKAIETEHPAVPANRIRVNSNHTVAQAPKDCPDWSYDYMANYRNSVLSNFGCASSTNLVRMVEDPNDLVAGTGDSGADAQRSSGVLEGYREPPGVAPSVGGASQTGGQ